MKETDTETGTETEKETEKVFLKKKQAKPKTGNSQRNCQRNRESRFRPRRSWQKENAAQTDGVLDTAEIESALAELGRATGGLETILT